MEIRDTYFYFLKQYLEIRLQASLSSLSVEKHARSIPHAIHPKHANAIGHRTGCILDAIVDRVVRRRRIVYINNRYFVFICV